MRFPTIKSLLISMVAVPLFVAVAAFGAYAWTEYDWVRLAASLLSIIVLIGFVAWSLDQAKSERDSGD